MRVRISYSVDLEDVPEECSRMLQEAASEINKVYEELESLVDQLNTENAVQWRCKDYLERCRNRLTKIDMVLADSSSILDGYFEANKEKEPSNVADEG